MQASTFTGAEVSIDIYNLYKQLVCTSGRHISISHVMVKARLQEWHGQTMVIEGPVLRWTFGFVLQSVTTIGD